LYRGMGHEVHVYSRQYRDPWRPCDVIQVHYPLPEYNIPFVEQHRGSSPVIAFLHGAEAIRTPDKPLLWGLRAKFAVKRFAKSCDAVVTVSKWMAAEVESYLGISPTVIPNPVDPVCSPLSEDPAPAAPSASGVASRRKGWTSFE